MAGTAGRRNAQSHQGFLRRDFHLYPDWFRIDSLASSDSFQQVSFPFQPVKAWNAGSAAVSADPSASTIGSNLIVRRVVADPVKKLVFGHISGQCLIASTKTLVSGE